MVKPTNKQTFYPNPVGAVLQRTRSNAICILTAPAACHTRTLR